MRKGDIYKKKTEESYIMITGPTLMGVRYKYVTDGIKDAYEYWARETLFNKMFEKVSVVKVKVPTRFLASLIKGEWDSGKVYHSLNKQWNRLLKEQPEIVMFYAEGKDIVFLKPRNIEKKRQLGEDTVSLEWDNVWATKRT